MYFNINLPGTLDRPSSAMHVDGDASNGLIRGSGNPYHGEHKDLSAHAAVA